MTLYCQGVPTLLNHGFLEVLCKIKKVCDGGKGIVRESWMGMYILLYLKWITNKD